MPFQRGGWAQWQNVQNWVDHDNELLRGDRSVGFYICGDQMSQLPGWQEGAVASALNAVGSIAVQNYSAPSTPSVPDSRIVVEGLIPLGPDR